MTKISRGQRAHLLAIATSNIQTQGMMRVLLGPFEPLRYVIVHQTGDGSSATWHTLQEDGAYAVMMTSVRQDVAMRILGAGHLGASKDEGLYGSAMPKSMRWKVST